MKSLLALCLILLSGCTTLPHEMRHYRSVTFYTCAHPDDCQLFMNPNLQNDIALQSNKVVTIYLTSGDAGNVKKDRKHEVPFYVARENGALEAARWLADIDNQPQQEQEDVRDTIEINGKTLLNYRYDNTITYFMRLPDGMGDGEGHPKTGVQSLKKLENGSIATLTAIDGSASYTGWKELAHTLQMLIELESAGIPSVTVNFQDPDLTVNTGDHPDHIYTGLLTLAAIAPHPCISTVRFQDYVTDQEAPNLDRESLLTDAGAFAIISASIGKAGYKNTWDKVHHSWLGRNYFKYTPSFQNCMF